ncbi:MAG: VacJ family lipoprotein [Myxococcota bacterium]
MHRSARFLALALLAGAIGSLPLSSLGEETDVENVETADPVPSSGVHDPWEPLNRATFAFNDTTDRWFLEPVAIGWDTVVPHRAQQGISDFFANLAFPRQFVNAALQGNGEAAGHEFGRFVMNTLFGLGGLLDPATAVGIPNPSEDFGQTLGVWGVPAGPYLVIPFLGPSNPRDAVGLIVDNFLAVERWFVPATVSYVATATEIVNLRALSIETIRAERASAFDFYAAVRSASVQFRANQVRDREEAPDASDADEDLYYFDDEEEYDDALEADE